MKVISEKSAHPASRILALAICFMLAAFVGIPHASRAASQEKLKPLNEKLSRNAKSKLREGKFEEALKIYRSMTEADPGDVQPKLGASFANFKLQDYVHAFELAMEVIKTNPNNARAHALAGVSLLRSGFIRGAIGELQQALNLDDKEALAYGGAAEIDYYEGRAKDSRSRSFFAHQLEPEEPDYLITYARASSRVEDFKEAADAYELFLEVAPATDTERRDRIHGLIQFYRRLAGLQVHQLSGPLFAQIPFQLGSDRRPYVKLKLNGREATFVIDTGSGFTVLSKDAAKKFGVSEIARGGKSQGVGGTGKFPIVYGLIKNLELGAVRVRMVPCFIRPFHSIQDYPAEQKADGFIGLSVLSRFLTELDYKEGQMRLDRSDRAPAIEPSPGITVIPFRTTQNGLISVETEFEQKERVNAILDSGASSTVISMAAVNRLNLRDQIIKGQTASVIGAAGVTDNVEVLFLRNCRVADQLQSNLRALVLDFGAINETSGFEQSGILGGDFLRHFKLTIDFNRALLALKPHSPDETKQ